MAGFDALGEVSKTLRQVLDDSLATLPLPPLVEISDLSGAIATAPPRVTLFLFEVIEDGTARTSGTTRELSGTGAPILRRAPAALLARYLVTAWYDDVPTAHTVLGRVIQTFHDKAVLTRADLTPPLAATTDALRIKLVPLTIEDQARIWHAVQKVYRLALVYEVRVVRIDSEAIEPTSPVRSMSGAAAVPDAHADGGP